MKKYLPNTQFKIKFAVKLSKKAIFAALILVALLNLSVIPYVTNKAQAADLTSAKITIGDSRASVSTSHAFAFTTATTATLSKVTFQYCTEATTTGTCTAPTGLNITSPGSPSVSGIGAGSFSNSGSTLTYTVTTPASVTSATAVTITAPTITNPSTINTSFFVRILTYDNAGTPAIVDGPTVVAFAILDTNSMAASATIDATFTFTVAGVASSTNVTGGSINLSTNVTSTANTIPFGSVSAGSANKKTAANLMTVTTNAQSGYTVTVKASDPPMVDTSTGGVKNIDKFTGTNATPTDWTSPSGTTASVNTAFLGYSTNDTTLGTGTAGRFTTVADAKWAGSDFTSPLEVAYSSTSIASDQTYVLWRLEANTSQPNGSYTGTVTLVATPTY